MWNTLQWKDILEDLKIDHAFMQYYIPPAEFMNLSSGDRDTMLKTAGLEDKMNIIIEKTEYVCNNLPSSCYSAI